MYQSWMNYICSLLIVGVIYICGCNNLEQREKNANNIPQTELATVDSLALRFHFFRDAVLHLQTGEFKKLIDSRLSSELSRQAKKSRFSSSLQYFKWQNPHLPALDTLQFYEIQESGVYRRIAYTGNILTFANQENRIRYTYLLYHRESKDWKLSGLASVDCDRYDSFGRELTIHETDLPSSMRFPKVL